MAFANTHRHASSALSLDLSATVYALMNRIADYRAYRRTVAELSQLNNHELVDLGMSRASINDVAHRAVYGKSA